MDERAKVNKDRAGEQVLQRISISIEFQHPHRNTRVITPAQGLYAKAFDTTGH